MTGRANHNHLLAGGASGSGTRRPRITLTAASWLASSASWPFVCKASARLALQPSAPDLAPDRTSPRIAGTFAKAGEPCQFMYAEMAGELVQVAERRIQEQSAVMNVTRELIRAAKDKLRQIRTN